MQASIFNESEGKESEGLEGNYSEISIFVSSFFVITVLFGQLGGNERTVGENEISVHSLLLWH